MKREIIRYISLFLVLSLYSAYLENYYTNKFNNCVAVEKTVKGEQK